MSNFSVLLPIQGPFASFQQSDNKRNKPSYKDLPLPHDWTIVRTSGMKLYLHTPSGVLTDKDPRRPKAHKVIKGKITKLLDATRRGSAELLETISSSSRVVKPTKMRSKTKSYEHKIKRTPLSAPAASSRKSLRRAHSSLIEKRVYICQATKKDLRPGMVRRGRQPVYHVHPALKSEAVRGSASPSLETIAESD